MRRSEAAKPVGTQRHVALAQGVFNLVGGLLVTAGIAQLAARSDDELRIARVLGLGVASTLGAIDAVYVPKGRISAMYLQDLVCEVFWVAAWRRACRMN